VLPEEEFSIFPDDGYGAIDAVAFGAQGVVGAGDVEAVVDQEIKGEMLLFDELLVAGGVGLIDTVGLGVEGAEGVAGVAHGGELIRSARGAVAGVEEEGGAPFAA
jgi:hypothetical protein